MDCKIPGLVQRISDRIIDLNSVDELDLSHLSIGDAGLSLLCKGLRLSPKVRLLDLSDCGVSASGARLLFLALAEEDNQSLRKLYLRGGELGDSSVTFMVKFLSKPDCPLVVLDLSYPHFRHKLTSRGIWELGMKGLSENHSLEVLDLSGNDIGDEGTRFLCQGLQASPKSRIRELLLGKNEIGIQGGILLASYLKQNSTLEKLDLSHNALRDEGCSAIAESLRSNSTLISLNLKENRIGGAGAWNLVRTIVRDASNSDISELNIEGVLNVDFDFSHRLGRLLEANLSLRSVEFSFPIVSEGHRVLSVERDEYIDVFLRHRNLAYLRLLQRFLLSKFLLSKSEKALMVHDGSLARFILEFL